MFGTYLAKTGLVGALGIIAKIANKFLTAQKNSSLSDFTSVLRVEPVTLIDKRLERVDYLPDVLQVCLSLFSGYYLQAVACMANVGQINVMRMLDAVNPSRDGSLASAAVVDAINGTPSIGMLSMESYQGFRLPRPDDSISMEAMPQFKNVQGSVQGNLSGQDKNIKQAVEVSNLAVGKLLEVNIENNGSKGTFPVSVRLATAYVDNEVLTHILGGSGHDNSMRERIHRFKAGELQLIRDILLCEDMIREETKLLMKDKTGALAELNARRAANSAAAMATGTPSIANSSALVVVSKETITDLERANLGKMSDVNFRKKIYNQAMAMIIAVVDTDYETVTFYTRGIDLPSKYSIRELKSANKGGGSDVGEILKAYRLGSSPVI